MGFTSVKITLANPKNPKKTRRVDLLVDTGAMYSMVPKRLLKELEIDPLGKRSFRLASGEKIQREVGVPSTG